MMLPLTPSNPIGEYVNIYIARSKDPEILSRRVGSGGAVTSILCYLLDKGICDAVVVARRTKGFEGSIIIAKTRREVIEAAGSRWSIVPFTSRLRRIIEENNLRSIAIVGLPCQAQFLGHMRTFPILETDFGERIKIIISLFCMGTFAHEVFLTYLRSTYNIHVEDIEDIRVERENLVIMLMDNRRIEIPVNEIASYLQTGCLACTDYTGVSADISAGMVSSLPGYTVLITRTQYGDNIVHSVAREGYIEVKEADQEVVKEIMAKAIEKIERANIFTTKSP